MLSLTIARAFAGSVCGREAPEGLSDTTMSWLQLENCGHWLCRECFDDAQQAATADDIKADDTAEQIEPTEATVWRCSTCPTCRAPVSRIVVQRGRDPVPVPQTTRQ